MNKKSGSVLVVGVILIVLAIAIFGGIYFLKIKNEKRAVETQTIVSIEPKNCNNNMDCLIAAASKCQAISAVISYSVPSLFLPQMVESGQNKYEIKPSQGPGSCTLITTILSASFAISNADRRVLLNGGTGSKLPSMTAAQIDSGLKQSNDGVPKVLNTPASCTGSSSAVASYLTDVEKHTQGDSMSFVAGMLTTSGGTMTLKTSSGQKLTCSLK